MATTPSQKPVASELPQDLKFNSGKIDEFVTSMGWTYTDRFGNKHYTIEGINYLAQQAMAAFGYTVLSGLSFDTGATITDPNQILFNDADNSYYKWTGSLAAGQKVVPENSTPETSGGVGPGKWLNVGDTGLRNEIFALNGGVSRTFQTTSDMKSFAVESGHSYSTLGYYTIGDGGGGIYLASTTGTAPDGYGDHVASNGIFLRLMSNPTDLNHGVKVVSTFDPPTAWHNRNAIQSMANNPRWSSCSCIAIGGYYHLGSTHIDRDNYIFEVAGGCKIIGRYDDPSIPESTISQSGAMLTFAHFFDPEAGDFIPWRPDDVRVNAQVYSSHFIINGDISTEYNDTHSNKYNNNAMAFFKGNRCTIKGVGGCSGSDHRAFNFDADGTKSSNFGGSVNVEIDVAYSQNVVNNHCMIAGSSATSSAYGKVKIGYAGAMLSGGISNPLVIRVSGGLKFDVEIGNFEGGGTIKPALVAAFDATEINLKCGRCAGASKILYQSNTLYSDVEVSQIYNTPVGIERAGTSAGRMRQAVLHDVRFTDTAFTYAYLSTSNPDGFFRLSIKDNYFVNASPSFAYYGNRITVGLPIRLDIRDNYSPGGMTVVDLNLLPNQISANLVTSGVTTIPINFKSPDWNYTKMTVLVENAGVKGAVEIDLRTRVMTLTQVNYIAGAISILTTLSGSTLTIATGSAGATLQFITLHN
ncbi:hypothetical protein [Buttiauxella gaviniae]|uniref:tail fiber/spike domain-containing protein n=1 Tax=Buttiauxella gaviniae TaxID=82990 RepID=UPI0039769EC6